jgi:fatty acid amide hydrolase
VAFLKAMDHASRMDLILLPGFSIPAAPHGASADPQFLGTNTILFNLLGFPAGILPWTVARAGEETGPMTMVPAMRGHLKGSAGLPFAVQVVARPWREHMALAAMQVLEAAARKRPDYPHAPPE